MEPVSAAAVDLALVARRPWTFSHAEVDVARGYAEVEVARADAVARRIQDLASAQPG